MGRLAVVAVAVDCPGAPSRSLSQMSEATSLSPQRAKRMGGARIDRRERPVVVAVGRVSCSRRDQRQFDPVKGFLSPPTDARSSPENSMRRDERRSNQNAEGTAKKMNLSIERTSRPTRRTHEGRNHSRISRTCPMRRCVGGGGPHLSAPRRRPP